MDKLLQMIGMAKRAGKVITGEMLSEKAVKAGESFLVIIAADISDNGRKSIINSCNHYNVEYIEYADRALLGKFTGGGERTVISINDRGFADTIKSKYYAQA